MKKTIALLVALLYCMPVLMLGQRQLRFGQNGKFVIAQFTDVHWTPRSPKIEKTATTIRAVLKQEQPDLAVLSGDIVTDQPASDGWRSIVAMFEEAETPFIVTMGNHDPEVMKRGDIYDILLKSPYYMGGKGPQELTGMGNCILPIYSHKSKDKIEAVLYFIDSNDYPKDRRYGSYDAVHFDQIAWYRSESTRLTSNNGGLPFPALAFFHIPIPEYKDLVSGKKAFGNQDEDVASSKVNSGLFASFLDMRDVMGAFTGHDHNNDYIGIDKGIALAYGRVTGDNAYGTLTRGGRIIELVEGQRKFDTWITTPQGRESRFYYPSGLTSREEETMEYLVAKEVADLQPGVAYTYYEGKCQRVADIPSCKEVKRGVMKNISIKDAPKPDHFAYEFRSLINIPERGVYNFYVSSDDGSVLYIDDKEVVNNDGGHYIRRREGKIALEKGLHELRVLYFEDYMGEALEVGYSARNIFETTLSEDMLFLPQDKMVKRSQGK